MQDWHPPGGPPVPGTPAPAYLGSRPGLEPGQPARYGWVAAAVLAAAVVVLALVTVGVLAHGRRAVGVMAGDDQLLAILLVFNLPPLAAAAALAGLGVATVALVRGRSATGSAPSGTSGAAVGPALGAAAGCGVVLAAAAGVTFAVLDAGPSVRVAGACVVAAAIGGAAAVGLSSRSDAVLAGLLAGAVDQSCSVLLYLVLIPLALSGRSAGTSTTVVVAALAAVISLVSIACGAAVGALWLRRTAPPGRAVEFVVVGALGPACTLLGLVVALAATADTALDAALDTDRTTGPGPWLPDLLVSGTVMPVALAVVAAAAGIGVALLVGLVGAKSGQGSRSSSSPMSYHSSS